MPARSKTAPDLAKVVILRQMKSEEVIVQRIGGELQKLDLALHRDADAGVVDLLGGQACAGQQRRQGNARGAQARGDQAGDSAGGARHRMESHQSGSTHEANLASCWLRSLRCMPSMSAWNVKCLAHDNKIARALSPKSSRLARPVAVFRLKHSRVRVCNRPASFPTSQR
jgi:hypothetical protein